MDARWVEVGKGRRYVLTDSGHFGLASERSEVGDIVCILLGCSVAAVLRQVGEHYMFIGESYVHGIMQGEIVAAFEKEEVQLQEFE